MQHDQAGEGLAFAGAVAGGVEGVGDTGVGVIVEEPVEEDEGRGVMAAATFRPNFGTDSRPENLS